nr:GntR family transcriptional regulator [Domibacillus indicus]
MSMNYPASWLQSASLGEKMASDIRLQIIDGTIKPGTILSENQIALEFGTSRSPVREALKKLSNEGLIELKRMGAVVLGLKQKDIEELRDVRFLIENFAVKRLSMRDSEELVKKLNYIIDKMEMAAKHKDAVDFAYQDLTFHETFIVEVDHNRIGHMWQGIRDVVLTALLVATEKRFTYHSEEIGHLINRHRFIVEALASKNREHIEKAIRAHYEDTRKTVSKISDETTE